LNSKENNRMAETIQCNASIFNRSNTQTLTLVDSGLTWGKWTMDPPKSVAQGETVQGPHSSGKEGAAAGTTGWVKYQFGDDEKLSAKFSWDVVWDPFGTNKYTTEVGDNRRVMIAVEGWSGTGSVETPVVEIALLA
jgi:Aegerolysin